IATMPQAFVQEFVSRTSGSNGGLMLILIEIIIWFIIILACIMLVMAVRQIPVQYARRTASGGYEKNVFGSRQYIPLKLNASGVMPIIFAQAIMFAPAYIGRIGALKDTGAGQWLQTEFSNIFGLWYNIVFAVLIIIFSYILIAIIVPTIEIVDNLKRICGFIRGILPVKESGDNLDKIISLISFHGSLSLALTAVLPAIVLSLMGVQQGWA